MLTLAIYKVVAKYYSNTGYKAIFEERKKEERQKLKSRKLKSKLCCAAKH